MPTYQWASFKHRARAEQGETEGAFPFRLDCGVISPVWPSTKMVETKNPAIKLFGMRIKVLPSPDGVPHPTSPVADSVEEEDDVETEQVQLSHELALFCESEGTHLLGQGESNWVNPKFSAFALICTWEAALKIVFNTVENGRVLFGKVGTLWNFEV